MSPWHTDTDSSGSEAPTRIVIVLARLLDGLDAIRCERERSLEIVTKAARDSVPALRLAVPLTHDTEDDLDTKESRTRSGTRRVRRGARART